MPPCRCPHQAGKIQLGGDPSALETYAGLLDTFDPNFNIITPYQPRASRRQFD